MKPQDFNKVKKLPIGLGMGKIEWEEFACVALNKHIETNTSFDTPLKYAFSHSDMVNAGLLEDHGNLKYTLTKKSLGLLWAMFGK